MSRAARPGAAPEQARQTKPKDYLVRFVFGVMTVITGLVSAHWGPIVGGLFLAFPAILPASLTLVVRHAGKIKAGDDAAGAAVGALGLAVFAVIVWKTARTESAWLVLALASAAWLIVSVGACAGCDRIGLLPDDEKDPREDETPHEATRPEMREGAFLHT
jgi:hypothetical protein